MKGSVAVRQVYSDEVRSGDILALSLQQLSSLRREMLICLRRPVPSVGKTSGQPSSAAAKIELKWCCTVIFDFHMTNHLSHQFPTFYLFPRRYPPSGLAYGRLNHRTGVCAAAFCYLKHELLNFCDAHATSSSTRIPSRYRASIWRNTASIETKVYAHPPVCVKDPQITDALLLAGSGIAPFFPIQPPPSSPLLFPWHVDPNLDIRLGCLAAHCTVVASRRCSEKSKPVRVCERNPEDRGVSADFSRSLAQGARNRLPAPGTIIASSYTSPLDVLYLAAIFDPIFTQSQHGSRQVRAISLESALASCFSVQNPLEMVGEQPKATDLLKLTSQNPGRVIVVFPESTTSNGRGILTLSPSLLSAARDTKIYPVSLRYTPADVVTPIPGWFEAARFIWRLNSRQTHCIRVRIGGSLTLSNPGVASSESSPIPAKRALPVKNGMESNFFDTLQASAKQQPNNGVEEDDLSSSERQVLDAVADSLARLGRVKRVDLGVEQKTKFVQAWSKKGR
nr:putative lysophosphatidic acid:oleoyl-coa acyltransferase [Quercus suber]